MRTLWGTGVLRWLFSVAFLFAAFIEFSDHKWSIGLGLLVFEYAVATLVGCLQIFHAEESRVADLAERKTRHTTVLAAERAGQADLNEGDFWGEVNRRVSAEVPEPEKTGFWAATGLVVGGTLWRLVSSLFGIGLVAALTSS